MNTLRAKRSGTLHLRQWHRILALLFLLPGIWYIGGAVTIHAKAILAQVLLQQAWDKTLQGEQRVKPWGWADTWPVARLRLSRLDVDQLVLAGASGRTLAFGPGQVDGTSGLSQQNNRVISGHRDTHFSWLAKVQDGDEIMLELPDGQQMTFQVVQRSIHHESETELLLDSGFPLLRLITCYPFDAIIPGGPLRFVVTGRLLTG